MPPLTGTQALKWAPNFSYMLESRPGAYLFMGIGDAAGLHNTHYDFNDEALPHGASFCTPCGTCLAFGMMPFSASAHPPLPRKRAFDMALEDAKTQIDHAFMREDARGLSYENAFAGAVSFLRRKYTKELSGVDLAITGVPFDQAVTNRTGTRLGPRALRKASTLQPYDPPYGWGFDPLGEFAIVDYGDLALITQRCPNSET